MKNWAQFETTEARPLISLAFFSFLFFSCFLSKPSPIALTLSLLPHHTHDPQCADTRSSSKDHREEPDERQRPKILLSSQNQTKNLKPSHQLQKPQPPTPPLARLCVKEPVSTLAETSAQGNSNEDEMVRETERKGERGAQ